MQLRSIPETILCFNAAKHFLGQTEGMLSWIIENGEVTITDCKADAKGEIVIPGNIEGYPVTVIGSHSFEDCTEITEITIPDSVINIQNYAFYNCSGIKKLTMPCSAKIYDSPRTFYECISMEEITLTIGTSIMQNYSDQNNIFPSASKTYYEHTPWFISRNNIQSINIEDGINNNGDYAFRECTCLKSFTIPDSIVKIGTGAFYNCKELTSITIPESVTSIGEYAFYGCTGLTNVILPDSITNIGRYAFKECSNITSVRMSNSIEIIREGTFSCCTGLIDIIIPDSVTQIDSLVFFKCTGLKRITLSKNIKGLKSAVFSGCTSIENITIPDNVKIIGSQAFYNCSALKEITFPDNYLRIESKSFYGCTNLVNVIIHNEVDFERDTFSGADKVTLINAEDNAPNTKVLAEQYKVNRIDVVYKMNKKVIYFVGDTTVYEGVEYDYIMKALNNYSEAEYMFFSKLVFDGLKKEDFIMDIDNEMDVSIIDSSAEDLTFNNLYINISMLDENGSANVTFEYLLNEMKNGNGDAFSIVLQSDEDYYEQSVVTKAVNKIFEDALNVIARAINWIARRFR